MKVIFTIIIVIGINAYLFGQSSGFIIVGGDSTATELTIKKRKTEDLLYFRHSYDETWHTIIANNADEAFVPGEWKYLSIELPSGGDKVWARCIFYGLVKLVQYKSEYYIIDELNLERLSPPSDAGLKRRFVGQMIALLSSRVDFDFNTLSYDSKSLAEPLIILHQKKGVTYQDYNKYIHLNSATLINGTYALTNGSTILNAADKFSLNGQSAGLGVTKELTFPDFTPKLTFAIGVEVQTHLFNEYLKKIRTGESSYLEFNNTLYSAGINGSVQFHLVDKPTMKLSLNAGVKAVKMFGSDTKVRVETLEDNVVQTRYTDIKVDDRTLLYQFDQIVLGLPNYSESFLLGVGGSFLLSKSVSTSNSIGINRSIHFSIYYTL